MNQRRCSYLKLPDGFVPVSYSEPDRYGCLLERHYETGTPEHYSHCIAVVVLDSFPCDKSPRTSG